MRLALAVNFGEFPGADNDISAGRQTADLSDDLALLRFRGFHNPFPQPAELLSAMSATFDLFSSFTATHAATLLS